MPSTQPTNAEPASQPQEPPSQFQIMQVMEAPNLADCLSQVQGFLRRYIVFPNRAHSPIIALWVAHSHALAAFDFTPYLHITSPEKRCGKTRVLDSLNILTPEPWFVASPTEAVIYRMIAEKTPTMLLDEVDTIFNGGKGKEDAREGLRAVLNVGFSRSALVPRCTGSSHEIENFPVFCAKVIAGIGKLPDTVADRAIPIVLARKTKGESVERFRSREAEALARPIREALAAWARVDTHILRLRDARPDLPESLGDRQADICEPLLAIADAAGGVWPELGRSALVSLLTTVEEDVDSLGVKMLTGIRRAFADAGASRLTTEQLLDALMQDESGPWVERWERDLNNGNRMGPASRLAKILKPYGIRSGSQRLANGSTAKGYVAGDFAEAWRRYLAPASPDVETA